MSVTTSNRLLDVEGKVPSGNFGVFVGKSIFKNHRPYITVGTLDVDYVVEFNFHFLKNIRRLLAGTTGDTQFNKAEKLLYDDYMLWGSDTTLYTGERLEILEQLDKWFIDEIQGLPHYSMSRNYIGEVPWS